MGFDVKILDCHGACSGCYEADIRRLNKPAPINIQAIISAINAAPTQVSIHGGEPLSLPIRTLEKLLRAICEKWGSSGIQTSLAGMSEKHLSLFKRYQTHVGVSIDGMIPSENKCRWDKASGEPGVIEGHTENTLRWMGRLRDSGVKMSAIIVLRTVNAGPEKIGMLKNFILTLSRGYGIKSIRLNNFIAKSPGSTWQELSPEVLADTYASLWDLAVSDPELDIQPYRDFINLLMGNRDSTCMLGQCDPYRTGAEMCIMADGNIGACLKTGMGSDGIQGLSADSSGFERYELLRDLPQENGGCAGCRFWQVCQGGCPGEAIDNDWRNRSRFCIMYKNLFAFVEFKLKAIFPNLQTSISTGGDVFLDSSKVSSSIGGSTWEKNKAIKIDVSAPPGGKRLGRDYGDHGDRPHGDHIDYSNPVVTK